MPEAHARQLGAEEEQAHRFPRAELHVVEPGGSHATSGRTAEASPAPLRGREAALADRRTVRISGQTTPARRRRSPTAAKLGRQPDRMALWAVMLGVFLGLMAVATARAEVPSRAERGSQPAVLAMTATLLLADVAAALIRPQRGMAGVTLGMTQPQARGAWRPEQDANGLEHLRAVYGASVSGADQGLLPGKP